MVSIASGFKLISDDLENRRTSNSYPKGSTDAWNSLLLSKKKKYAGSEPELERAYLDLIEIYEMRATLATFEAVLARFQQTFMTPEEVFAPDLIPLDGRPAFHVDLVGLLSEMLGPALPSRVKPQMVAAVWLFDYSGSDSDEDKSIASLLQTFHNDLKDKAESSKRHRAELAAIYTQNVVSSAPAEHDRLQVEHHADLDNQVANDTPTRPEDEPVHHEFEHVNHATPGENAVFYTEDGPRDFPPLPTRPPYSQEQLDSAVALQAGRAGRVGTGQSQSRGASRARGHNGSYSRLQERSEGEDDYGIPVAQWRHANWNEDASLANFRGGDRELNMAFNGEEKKFSGDDRKKLISRVHTNFVNAACRYKFTKRMTVKYLANIYSGRALQFFENLLLDCARADTQLDLDVVFQTMEDEFENAQTRREASEQLGALRVDENAGTRINAVVQFRKSFYSLLEAANLSSTEQQIGYLQRALCDVGWTKQLRAEISAAKVSTLSDAFSQLQAMARTEDRDDPVSSSNFTPSASFDNRRVMRGDQERSDSRDGFASSRGGFTKSGFHDNRSAPRSATSAPFARLTRWQKAGHSSNPIDRRTGLPMTCRSPGCNSTTHFQFSGQCPVQKRRIREGVAREYMAQCVLDCVEGEGNVEALFEEIVWSQPGTGADDDALVEQCLEAGVAEAAEDGNVDVGLSELVAENLFGQDEEVENYFATEAVCQPMPDDIVQTLPTTTGHNQSDSSWHTFFRMAPRSWRF